MKEKLYPYLPKESVDTIYQWLKDYNVSFRITKKRASKLGDYRSPFKEQGHRISINGDLNPYSFLITTVHEFAHLVTWEQHKHKVKPHGLEWKNSFKKLMDPFLADTIFPDDVKSALVGYMNNPAAASCTDLNLMKVLRKYDKKDSTLITVEELEPNAKFLLGTKRVFVKGNRIRKRYKCMELSTKRYYLFNPLAEVKKLEE